MITITEPATLLTDYLLALFTAVLGRQLRRVARDAEWSGFIQSARQQNWWSLAFMATAVAGAAGGTVHGFQRSLPRSLTNLLWLATLESLVFAAFAVVGAAIVLAGWGRTVRFIATYAAAVAFGSYALWVVKNPVFRSAIMAYGAAFAVLVGVRLYKRPLGASGWLLLAGVAVSLAAAAIQQSGVSIHRHFNHNDLYHVVQAVGVWLLYFAARRA
jgi:hypothetical protein